MRPRLFLIIVMLSIVASRAAVILTSHDDGQVDLSIYQEVGQLVVNGIDPYDFEANKSRRMELRDDGHGMGGWAKEATTTTYDYLVSGNPPGSTLLYGLLEWLSGGRIKLFRLLMSLGDVALAGAAYFFVRRCGIRLEAAPEQIPFFLVTVLYPSLIFWGLVRAEDKQFETAALLWSAGLLVRARATSMSAALIGASLSISIIFKALGVFLVPLAIDRLRRLAWKIVAIAAVSGVLIVVLFCAFFDDAFLRLLLARVVGGTVSSTIPIHASPWQLVPVYVFPFGRPLVAIGLFGLLLVGCARGAIDLLNVCAGTLVIAICVVTVSGGMDRMNMAMVFALFCVATLGVSEWRVLVLVNFWVQLPIFGVLIGRAPWLNFFNTETPEAIATAVFLASYFAIMTSRAFRGIPLYRRAGGGTASASDEPARPGQTSENTGASK